MRALRADAHSDPLTLRSERARRVQHVSRVSLLPSPLLRTQKERKKKDPNPGEKRYEEKKQNTPMKQPPQHLIRPLLRSPPLAPFPFILVRRHGIRWDLQLDNRKELGRFS